MVHWYNLNSSLITWNCKYFGIVLELFRNSLFRNQIFAKISGCNKQISISRARDAIYMDLHIFPGAEKPAQRSQEMYKQAIIGGFIKNQKKNVAAFIRYRL